MRDKKQNDEVNFYLKEIAHNRLEAVDQLYVCMQARLFFVAYKHLRDRSKAEDLTSDFWDKIVIIAKNYKFGRNPIGYLLKVISNMAKLQLRKTSGKKHIEVRLNEDILKDYEEIDFYGSDKEKANEIIRESLRVLTEKERLVMYLTFWENKKIRECAKECNVSEKTIEKHKKAAYEKIKKFFAERGWEESDF